MIKILHNAERVQCLILGFSDLELSLWVDPKNVYLHRCANVFVDL